MYYIVFYIIVDAIKVRHVLNYFDMFMQVCKFYQDLLTVYVVVLVVSKRDV